MAGNKIESSGRPIDELTAQQVGVVINVWIKGDCEQDGMHLVGVFK